MEQARGDRFHWTPPDYELPAKTVVDSVLRELELGARVSGNRRVDVSSRVPR